VLPAPVSELALWAEELPGRQLVRPLRPRQIATLVARATDAVGNSVSGVTLRFQILAGDGRLGPAQDLQYQTQTNHGGLAQVDLQVTAFGQQDCLIAAEAGELTSAPLLVEVMGPPVTVVDFSPEGSAFGDGFYISTATRITLTATTEDPGGIQAVHFDVDVLDPPQPSRIYTGSFSLAELGIASGMHTLRFYAEEVSGITESVQTVTLYTATDLQTDRQITNRPNPFRAGSESTIILFKPVESGTVTLTIYDLYGDVVLSRQLEAQAQATEQFVWDGRNGAGRVVANGGYVCHIQGHGLDLRRKIAVVK
jgi:hypothetical protein